jgi:hypothetical protein
VSARGSRSDRCAPRRPAGWFTRAALLGLLAAPGCGAPAAGPSTGSSDGAPVVALPASADGWRWAEGDAGQFTLGWRPASGALSRNESLSLDVSLRMEGAAIEGARLVVRGWMPEHAHGLVRAPVVTPLGEGAYRVDGLLLHMRGRWQLLFDVSHAGKADTVRFELEL